MADVPAKQPLPLTAEITEEIKTWQEIPTWAPGQPFTLIPTPAHVTGVYHEDGYNVAATHMALIHNVIVRGLNSIYLQARNVAPTRIAKVTPENKADVQLRDEFIEYCNEWCVFIHMHHEGEEKSLFPPIEKAIGIPGIMDGNIEQHKAFGDGIRRLEEYLKQVSPPKTGERVGEDKFLYGPELCEILDSFGEVLVRHLTEEISTLMALKGYRDVLDLKRLCDAEGEDAMKEASLFKTLCFVACNLDFDYEGGKHKYFPPAPWILMFLLRNVFWIPHRRLWKFGSCTSKGKLRPKLAYYDGPAV
ncbi:hypothetical protein DFH27DRAFT_506009 [Peziza echinospora]|nr:hypothetical protein DFH27DRAFT_506009 [Peziza echinospora]